MKLSGKASYGGSDDPLKKAASLIIALGSDVSSEIYRYLSKEEIEKLSYQISNTESVSLQQSDDAMKEFYEMCITQKAVSEGGEMYARDVLAKAFGRERASELMNGLEKSDYALPFEFLRKSDYKSVFYAVRNEHPQTIALILSYASPEMTSKVISELEPELQVSVMQRIASIGSVSPEVIKTVENVFHKNLISAGSAASGSGGIRYLAEILRKTDADSKEELLKMIISDYPEIAEALSDEMSG